MARMRERSLPVSVVIADDSSVVRERLAAMLGELPGVSVVGLSNNVSTTLDTMRSLRPDVLVLDLSMPGGSGLDVLRTISHQRLPTQVIVLTNYSFPEYEREARKYGASAFLNKSTQFPEVVEFVRNLANGGQPGALQPTPPVHRLTTGEAAEHA